MWAIARREDPRAIGRITLSDVNRDHGRGTLGFLLARAYWGRGLASEAQRLVLGHAFVALRLRRVEAFTDPRNTASVRSLQRLGFRREGLLRERWQIGDEHRDDVVYGLLARECTRTQPDADRTPHKPAAWSPFGERSTCGTRRRAEVTSARSFGG